MSAREESLAHGLPPMRPRLDSEAAGQWAPWHEQPEEARAALRGVVSPVSTGTEVLPRSTLQQAFSLLKSPETSLAHDPREPIPSPHSFPAAQAPSQQLATPTRDPIRPIESASSGSKSGTTASPGSRPAKRGMSPVVVFVIAFLVTTAVFGGAVAARWFGWFSFGEPAVSDTTPTSPATKRKAPPKSEAPPASEVLPAREAPPKSETPPASGTLPTSETPPASEAASAAASSSAAASAAAASSSRTKRPGGVTRPRWSPRTTRP